MIKFIRERDPKAILKMVKLELGCGKSKKAGFVGLDIKDYSKIYAGHEFKQQDIAEGIPYDDDSVEELHSYHFIEHIPDHFNKEKQIIEDGVGWIIREIHRVCKDGAKVVLEVPMFNLWEEHKHIFRGTAFKEYVDEGLFKEISRKRIWNHTLAWYALFNVRVELRVIK